MESVDFSTSVALHVLQRVNPSSRQWPCFIGPTGSGKTARVAQIADQLKLPVEVLLPGTALPEDILGLPSTNKGKTLWNLPEWAARAVSEPCLVFIDEMDKARPETHGALLTLLSGLEVRGKKLHPETKIVCAMQPVDRAEWLSTESGRAMSARLVFVPIGYDRTRIAPMWGCDPAALRAAAGEEQAPEIPTLPVVSDRQLEALSFLLSGASDNVASVIARGIAGERAEALLAIWRESRQKASISPKQVVELAIDDLSVIDGLTVPELVALTSSAFIHGTPAVFVKVLEQILLIGTNDDWDSAIKSIYPALQGAADQCGTITVFSADQSSEYKTTEELLRQVGDMIARVNAARGGGVGK